MPEFSIDPDILGGYRRRADAARATLKSAYDRSRDLRAERDSILATAARVQAIADASSRRPGGDPLDSLHSEDRDRLTKILAQIEEAAADERAAEREAERQNATAGRVVAYADKQRKAAEEAAFAARGEQKAAPPQVRTGGYVTRI